MITIRDFLVSWKIFVLETLNLTRESRITSRYFKPCRRCVSCEFCDIFHNYNLFYNNC